jgi:hypothetical protein
MSADQDRERQEELPPQGTGEGQEPPEGPKRPLRDNLVSYAGMIIMIFGGLLLVTSFIFSITVAQGSPYLGLLTYVFFPAIVLIGLVVFLLGARRESRRRRREPAAREHAYPDIDLNVPRTRKRFTRAVVGVLLMLAVFAYIGYNAFVFTESVTFCSSLCHTVMQPESVSHETSPHARVTCVACHVGTGASWYVRSKLSGVRQLFAVVFHTYPTPIPTPVSNLRPARNTCEECHWPEAFLGNVARDDSDYLLDRQNTHQVVSYILDIGGGLDPALAGGIHWHVAPEIQVFYYPADERYQDIPLVRVRRADGSTAEFRSLDTTATAQDLAQQSPRLMDCIDCHNRPTHAYGNPDDKVDQAIARGHIPAELPWIKKVGVEAVTRSYPSRQEAATALPKAVVDAYRIGYPAVYQASSAQVEKAAAALLAVWEDSIFPSMNVTWGAYYNNVGHRDWPGCFRCHDGRHVSASGQVLSKDCTLCHTYPQRRVLRPGQTPTEGAPQKDWHEMPLTGRHAVILCDACHTGTGTGRPDPTCAGCHQLSTKPPMMASVGCQCHQVAGQIEPLLDCRSCHARLFGLHLQPTHAKTPCETCHPAHTWAATSTSCRTCHPEMSNPASYFSQFKAPVG